MIVLGADGFVNTAGRSLDPSCALPLCTLDVCTVVCSFISLLPSGPLWDESKKKALEKFAPGCNADEDYCNSDTCGGLVDFAVYKGTQMFDLLQSALWPALRESNPVTAVTTLDEWLDRLGWVDCYRSQCRDSRLGAITPYEIPGPCENVVFCPPDINPELECAIKRAVVLSLTRLNMGVIKNLNGINWIIEPLHAVVTPYLVPTLNEDGVLCNTGTDCCDVKFQICRTSDTIESCPGLTCPQVPGTQISASALDDLCGTLTPGNEVTVWPASLSAECIVRALLPRTCYQNLIRCDD